MRLLGKVVCAAIGSLLIVGTMGLGFLAYIFWPHCDREEKILATDMHGRKIASCFKACTSIGTSMEESIYLISASGQRNAILEYAPNGGIIGCNGKTFPGDQEPSVDWSNPAVIRISIGVVSAIYRKQEIVDGVSVTYDIAAVISRDCGF